MNKLPQEFKEKWVAALKSGDYKQGKMRLHNQEENTYCCLGVLCAITGVESSRDEYIWGFPEEQIPVMLQGNRSNPVVNNLVRMNDRYGKSFSEIADYIEQNL